MSAYKEFIGLTGGNYIGNCDADSWFVAPGSGNFSFDGVFPLDTEMVLTIVNDGTTVIKGYKDGVALNNQTLKVFNNMVSLAGEQSDDWRHQGEIFSVSLFSVAHDATKVGEEYTKL
jgi:hypothetical protein